ncbi:MAG: 7-carboxy-7-deazaguanine synthase QueE [Candidatus Omnitrophica bacterium]|nr:7-carboxy-7-deazaguanine synthase QueE [Candidatus Omnitrophota bacterium]
MKGRIAEIFESIQGEGAFLGEQQIFVRFFGCNLNCSYCDTKLNSFQEYEPQELLGRIALFGNSCHSVAFTGGEPLLQKDFLKEVARLTVSRGYSNYLETNGTLYNELSDVLDYFDFIAMDIKLPSSGSAFGLWKAHRAFLEIAARKEVFLKCVISGDTSQEDLRMASALVKEVAPTALVVLQPNSFEERVLVDKKLEQARNVFGEFRISACVIPQLHKIVGMR